MNNHDLNVFATAARLGSITKAARALATVQSNVTTRIRLLEDELGVKLFDRTRFGISLTRKGGELLPYAEQMQALVQQARAQVSGDEATTVRSALRIGSLQSTASVRLPGILKTYLEKNHQVDLAVETGTAAELTVRVCERAVDGAFVTGPVVPAELEVLPAFVEEMVLITPAQYRTVDAFLASTGPVPKVLVFRPGCYYRRTLERHLGQVGADQLQTMEFGTLDGIIGCVGAGLGMTLLPRSVIARSAQRRHVRMHRLDPESARIEVSFITRRTGVRSLALERFIAVVRAARHAAVKDVDERKSA